jgi:parallel beta-helix repeat protein
MAERMNKRNLKIKKISTIIIISALILIFLTGSFSSISQQTNTIYVDEGGGQDYRMIQDAIDNASDGDTIYVYSGIYYETITINKILNVFGENATNTIIDGKYNNIVVNISEPFVKFSDFTVRNSNGFPGDAGIKTLKDNILIINCIFYNTKTGILIENSSENIVDNCSFQKNGEGICINKSNYIIVSGCCFNNNGIGLHIDGSYGSKIIYSYFHTNGISCYINSTKQFEMNLCNISDNSVNLGGIFFISCKDTQVNNSVINHNGAGFCIYISENITISNCDLIKNTHFAISLRTASKDIFIQNCEIRNSFRYGLYIEADNICKLEKCNIYDNHVSSVESKRGYCDARNNYWGSKYGPSFFNLIGFTKIKWIPQYTKYYPWATSSFQENGPNWDENCAYMNGYKFEIPEKIIQLSGEDTDDDGLPDWWEEKYDYDVTTWDDHLHLDPDGDALNNFQECYTDKWGSNPYQKDIFVEIDWMPCSIPEDTNRPPENLIEELKNIFLEHDIVLHVDLGEMGGGGRIPTCRSNFSFAKLLDLYWSCFLENDTLNPRKGIFHYGVICSFCPDVNFPFFGWDGLDSFAISSEWLKKILPYYSHGRLIVGAIVHHLGHSLGLVADTYKGIDNMGASQIFNRDWWMYRNYKSCMNYRYKYMLLSYSDGTNGEGDFDDWSNLDFSFFKNTEFKVK